MSNLCSWEPSDEHFALNCLRICVITSFNADNSIPIRLKKEKFHEKKFNGSKNPIFSEFNGSYATWKSIIEEVNDDEYIWIYITYTMAPTKWKSVSILLFDSLATSAFFFCSHKLRVNKHYYVGWQQLHEMKEICYKIARNYQKMKQILDLSCKEIRCQVVRIVWKLKWDFVRFEITSQYLNECKSIFRNVVCYFICYLYFI